MIAGLRDVVHDEDADLVCHVRWVDLRTVRRGWSRRCRGSADRPAWSRPIEPPGGARRLRASSPGPRLFGTVPGSGRRLDDLDDGRREDPEVVDHAAEGDAGGGDGRAVRQAVDRLGGAVLGGAQHQGDVALELGELDHLGHLGRDRDDDDLLLAGERGRAVAGRGLALGGLRRRRQQGAEDLGALRDGLDRRLVELVGRVGRVDEDVVGGVVEVRDRPPSCSRAGEARDDVDEVAGLDRSCRRRWSGSPGRSCPRTRRAPRCRSTVAAAVEGRRGDQLRRRDRRRARSRRSTSEVSRKASAGWSRRPAISLVATSVAWMRRPQVDVLGRDHDLGGRGRRRRPGVAASATAAEQHDDQDERDDGEEDPDEQDQPIRALQRMFSPSRVTGGTTLATRSRPTPHQ